MFSFDGRSPTLLPSGEKGFCSFAGLGRREKAEMKRTRSTAAPKKGDLLPKRPKRGAAEGKSKEEPPCAGASAGKGGDTPSKAPRAPKEPKGTQFQGIVLAPEAVRDKAAPLMAHLGFDEFLELNWRHSCFGPARRFQEYLKLEEKERDPGSKLALVPAEITSGLAVKTWGFPTGKIPVKDFTDSHFAEEFFYVGMKKGTEYTSKQFKVYEGADKPEMQEDFENLIRCLGAFFHPEKPKSWGKALVNAVAFDLQRWRGVLSKEDEKEWNGRPDWGGFFAGKMNQWVKALPLALKTPIGVPLFHLFHDLGLLEEGEYELGLEVDSPPSEGKTTATGVGSAQGGGDTLIDLGGVDQVIGEKGDGGSHGDPPKGEAGVGATMPPRSAMGKDVVGATSGLRTRDPTPFTEKDVLFMDMVWAQPLPKQVELLSKLMDGTLVELESLDGVREEYAAYKKRSEEDVAELKERVAFLEKMRVSNLELLDDTLKKLQEYERLLRDAHQEMGEQKRAMEGKYQALVRKAGSELPVVTKKLEGALGSLDCGSEKAVKGVGVLKNGLAKIVRDLEEVAASFKAAPAPDMGVGESHLVVSPLAGHGVQEVGSKGVEPDQQLPGSTGGGQTTSLVKGVVPAVVEASELTGAGSSTTGAGRVGGQT